LLVPALQFIESLMHLSGLSRAQRSAPLELVKLLSKQKAKERTNCHNTTN
jgi:hypothetical protein